MPARNFLGSCTDQMVQRATIFLHIVGSNTAGVKICSVSVWCPIFDITMLEKDTKTRTLNILQIIVYALMVTSCLTRNQSGACALEIFPPTSFK